MNDPSPSINQIDKLWPPIITGCVTISIFLFTIWKDKIKDGRKKRNETAQKSTYLINLLDDAAHHIQQQRANNELVIRELESSPSEFALLNYLPIDYLKRLSAVLANDLYFSAFNGRYAKIQEQKRIRLYNDLTIDIDLFQGYVTELYSYIERSAGHFEKFKENYFVNSKILLKNLADFHIKLEDNGPEDIDHEHLLSKLIKLDHEKMFEALRKQDMIKLNGEFITPIHQMLATFLRPDFNYIKSVTTLCQDCQNANEQYHGLLNTNTALSESLTQLNQSMQQTLDSFTEKLETLKAMKK